MITNFLLFSAIFGYLLTNAHLIAAASDDKKPHRVPLHEKCLCNPIDRSLFESLPVDQEGLIFIAQKLTPLFEKVPSHTKSEFCSLIKQMQTTPAHLQISGALAETDAVLQAPNSHLVVYENEYLRILEVIVKPGQQVPFHCHQWDSVMLTIQGSAFLIDDGKVLEEEDWDPMVENIAGSFDMSSYQNVGSTEFHAIALEFKH